MDSDPDPFRGARKEISQQEVNEMRKIKVQKNRNYLGTLLG